MPLLREKEQRRKRVQVDERELSEGDRRWERGDHQWFVKGVVGQT